MKATAAAVALMTTQLSDLLFGIGVGMGAALCQALQAFLGVGMHFLSAVCRCQQGRGHFSTRCHQNRVGNNTADRSAHRQ